ncbi:MAG: D-alanine--poly(phosphoribitol) ligase subunit DltA [Parvularculaceae bacterium]
MTDEFAPLSAFLDIARRCPNRIAVNDRGRMTDYGSLRDLTLRLAAEIIRCSDALNGKENSPAPYGGAPRVVIAAPSGAWAYAGMFGALAAGGFYCPVNVSAPDAKLAAIFGQLAPTAVLTEEREASRMRRLAGAECAIITPDALDAKPMDKPKRPHDLAYVMFTSGSTGAPKGVMVPQCAAANYVAWARSSLGYRSDDIVSQHPIIAFDISVTDIYGALASGACLAPFNSPADRLMPAAAIKSRGVTVWNSTPSVVNLMISANQATPDYLASVRAFNFCGEPLTPEQARAVLSARPDAFVQNTYGPTEATVACTAQRLTPDNLERCCRDSVALGGALPNMGVHLVGGADESEGEIVLTGAQLARGYWKNPIKTTENFRSLTINGEPHPAYFTGDIGRRDEGRLYFVTRKDHQVKINGHRVELGEVCAAIRKAGYLGCAAVVIDGELHAIIEGAQPDAATLDSLRSGLRAALEDYALPRRYHFVRRLPRNQNDKIDVKAAAEALRAAS